MLFQKGYANLNSIIFIEPIKEQQVQSMLKFFDVCYIGLKKENLFKYGVSPNNLFDYMYSTKVIVYAIDSGKNNIINVSKCGVTVEAENLETIKQGILKLYYMNRDERKKLEENGRKYVLKHFTYKKLAKKYEKLF